MRDRINNPVKYLEMSKPRSREEAAVAVDAFLCEVETLREKHRIADVIVVACHPMECRDGSMKAIGSVQMGDDRIGAGLGATAYRRFSLPVINFARRLERMAAGEDLPISHRAAAGDEEETHG